MIAAITRLLALISLVTCSLACATAVPTGTGDGESSVVRGEDPETEVPPGSTEAEVLCADIPDTGACRSNAVTRCNPTNGAITVEDCTASDRVCDDSYGPAACVDSPDDDSTPDPAEQDECSAVGNSCDGGRVKICSRDTTGRLVVSYVECIGITECSETSTGAICQIKADTIGRVPSCASLGEGGACLDGMSRISGLEQSTLAYCDDGVVVEEDCSMLGLRCMSAGSGKFECNRR